MLKEVENLIFYSRGDAEDVLSGLHDLVINHGKATIDDYYRLCGANSIRGNIDYGWTNLEDSIVTRRIGGYTIYLPTPVKLDNNEKPKTETLTDKVNLEEGIKMVPINIKQITFKTRKAAEGMLNCLDYLVDKYGSVTVDDYYKLAGLINTTYEDRKYGWLSVKEATIWRTRDGYTIYLPGLTKLTKSDGMNNPEGDKKIELRFQRDYYAFAPNNLIESIHIGMVGEYVDYNGTQKKVSSVKITENEVIVELV